MNPRYQYPRRIEAATPRLAGELTYDDIGKRVQFNYIFEPSKVGAMIYGNLQKVTHEGSVTTLYLSRAASKGSSMFAVKSYAKVFTRPAPTGGI